MNALQGSHEGAGDSIVDDRLCVAALHAKHHVGIGDVELILNVGGKDVPVGLDILLQVVGNGNDKVAVTRNGIVELAGVELCQLDALITRHLLIEKTA